MTKQRMSAADAAWLHMDRPANQMIVTSVMWFDEPLDWRRIRAILRDRLIAPFPRFSQRVVHSPVPTQLYWEDVEPFDVEAHLYRAVLPAPGGRAELQAFASSLQQRTLRPDAPLWELHLVDGFHGDGSALVWRIHHCVADGIALVRVLLSLTDDPGAPATVQPPGSSESGGLLPALVHFGGRVAHDAAHPGEAVGAVRDVAALSRALVKLLSLPPERHTALRGQVELSKRVLWSDPFPLAAVREAAHRHSVTVNDLVLGALSGALRAYLARRDGAARDVRAVLPINLRPLDEPLPAELGNRFGLAYLSLPVSTDDPVERLVETHRRTQAMKHSAEGIASYDVLEVVGHTTYRVEQVFVDIFAAKGSLVVTNVPGPTEALFVAGRRLRGAIAWPPESGNIGLGVSIMSYDGELVIGLLADCGLVDDPDAILAAVGRELAAAMSAGTEVADGEDVRPSLRSGPAGGLTA